MRPIPIAEPTFLRRCDDIRPPHRLVNWKPVIPSSYDRVFPACSCKEHNNLG
jgi:hypothetical protein